MTQNNDYGGGDCGGTSKGYGGVSGGDGWNYNVHFIYYISFF